MRYTINTQSNGSYTRTSKKAFVDFLKSAFCHFQHRPFQIVIGDGKSLRPCKIVEFTSCANIEELISKINFTNDKQ